MNALKITKYEVPKQNVLKPLHRMNKAAGYLTLFALLLLWPILRHFTNGSDETVGYIDPNIWLLILISLITFMIVIGLCRWLLQQFWMSLGLPTPESMVLQFKNLSVCQQFGFYWLSFVSLVLAAVGVLTAVL